MSARAREKGTRTARDLVRQEIVMMKGVVSLIKSRRVKSVQFKLMVKFMSSAGRPRLAALVRLSLCALALLLLTAGEARAQRQANRFEQSSVETPSKAATAGAQRWVHEVTSRQQFDRLSRTYNANLLHTMPHVLFVIDRQGANRIYYVNMNFYELHETFVNSLYLSLERGRLFWQNNHLKPDRRFILGRIAYHPAIKRFGFEFWEGDTISPELLAVTSKVIGKSFFAAVAFKPNSKMQEDAGAQVAGMARILPDDVNKRLEYQALNLSRGVGRINVVDELDENTVINSGDILVLKSTPIHLPPVSGIVVTQSASMLSHINILARSWGVPNAFIYNATEVFKKYDGQWVNFETKLDGYEIKPASASQVEECERRQALRRKMMTPQADTGVKRLASLRHQRSRDAKAYGAKSANLGELKYARLLGITVPDGFSIPFFYYDQFMRENRLDESLRQMLADRNFAHDAAYRRRQLAKFREAVQKGEVNAELRRELVRRMETEFSGKGLFVRSSANTEDLLNFSGAGLHSTVPNVRERAPLVEAVKTVWASLWNYEAFEVREHAGIDQSKVKMAVLIQEGINADSAGVLVTTDPFNQENAGAIYINAKRGLGIRVVEGQRISEQIIFNPSTSAMQVLTRSAEDSLLTFDEQGGLREVPVVGTRIVLTDELVRRLAQAGLAVKRVFGNREQDIEWVIRDGRIYIVQSRPYVLNSAGS